MICLSCGTENEAGRKFCHERGAGLAAVCTACGAAVVPGHKFCGECGATLFASTTRHPVDKPQHARTALRLSRRVGTCARDIRRYGNP